MDNLKAGDEIKCTIEKAPKAAAPTKTIQRLMRRDPVNVRSLRNAQNLRRKRMHVYTRGNRDWYSREKAARVTRVDAGNTWTMVYTPDIASDMASVQSYIKVEKA